MAEGFFCIFCSLDRREKERKIAQCSALSDKIVSRGTLSEKVLFRVQETIFTARIYRYICIGYACLHRKQVRTRLGRSRGRKSLHYGVLSKSAL